MVQGPLISIGSCTYFMDTPWLEREEEYGGVGGGKGRGVVSHRRRLMMDCTSTSCALQAIHFTTEGSGSFGPAAGCFEADVTRVRLFDWTKGKKTHWNIYNLCPPTKKKKKKGGGFSSLSKSNTTVGNLTVTLIPPVFLQYFWCHDHLRGHFVPLKVWEQCSQKTNWSSWK